MVPVSQVRRLRPGVGAKDASVRPFLRSLSRAVELGCLICVWTSNYEVESWENPQETRGPRVMVRRHSSAQVCSHRQSWDQNVGLCLMSLLFLSSKLLSHHVDTASPPLALAFCPLSPKCMDLCSFQKEEVCCPDAALSVSKHRQKPFPQHLRMSW